MGPMDSPQPLNIEDDLHQRTDFIKNFARAEVKASAPRGE